MFFTILLLDLLYFECGNLSVALNALKVMDIDVADRRRWQSAMTLNHELLSSRRGRVV